MTDLLKEYQKFTPSVAHYPRKESVKSIDNSVLGEWLEAAYLTLGLIEELAEVNTALAIKNTEKIEYELGDLLYYISQWCNFLNTDLQALFDIGVPSYYTLLLDLDPILESLGKVKKFLRGDFNKELLIDRITPTLRILANWAALTLEDYGSNIEIVILKNQTKLKDRQLRNQIKGDGDYR